MRKYYPFLASFFLHSLLIAGGLVGYSGQIGKYPSKSPKNVYTVYFGVDEALSSKEDQPRTMDAPHQNSSHEKAALKKAVVQKSPVKEHETLGKEDECSGGNEADLIPFSENEIPSYPEWARGEGLEGRFKLTLLVNAKGEVVKIDVSEASSDLNKLVEEIKSIVKTWRFKRSQKDSKSLTVPFEFVLT